jgi:hypothetical protein
MEGLMRVTFIPVLDRRRLLQSAAVLTTAAVNPITNVPRPVPPTTDVAPPPAPKLAVAPWLEQIARRNDLRKQAGLPLLSVATELRRIKSIQADQRFAACCAAFRPRVRAKLLSRRRRHCGDPTWRPLGWFAGIEFESTVNRQLQKLYQRVGKRFL